jgi:hypothetical protein
LGEEIISLRDGVHKRFFHNNGDNRGHIKQILKLQGDVKKLREQHAISNVNPASLKQEPSPSSPQQADHRKSIVEVAQEPEEIRDDRELSSL